ncbi:MAG TPA: PAS domain S-box protein, partial [Flavobacterium sp.]|nr:PAS domain S-box protein [Flavobacterium sp.]
LRRLGVVIGTLDIRANDQHIFGREEILFLTEVADDISFALDVLEKERGRKKAEKKLKIKNTKLRQAQEMAQLGTWEVDLEKKVGTWSPEILHMYGLPLDNPYITFNDWFSKVHPDDQEMVSVLREQAHKTHSSHSLNYRIVKNNGEVRHHVAQVKFEKNDEGKPTTMIGVAQDITDLHEIRQALSASEKAFSRSESRYRQIVELANDGICLLNEQGEIVFTNKRMVDIIGYAAEDYYGKDLLSFLFNKKNKISTINKKLKASDGGVIELCLKSNTGAPVWTRIASSPIVDESGNFNGTIAMISDISKRRAVETENRFKAHLLNNIGQAVIATNKKGIITYWNTAAEKIFNIKTEDVIGIDYKNIVELNRTGQAEEIFIATKNGQEWFGELETQQHLGDFTLYASAQPIYDELRKHTGMICVATNISEQRRLEKLLHSSARLAKLGHYEVDLIHETLYWSDLSKEIHEVPEDYIPIIENALQFYKAGINRDIITKAVNDAIAYGHDWDLELEFVTASGREMWVRSIGQVEVVNGKNTRIYGSIQDIDLQKKTEQSVLTAYKERDVILESIGDAFFAVDQYWLVNYWNINAEKILGKKREEMLGKCLWDVFPEYVGSEIYNNYHIAVATQTTVEFEELFFTYQKWLQVSAFPSTLGLSIYFKDITERKVSELQAVELNENLQAYASDLVAVNRELEQFSYMVSHNLRAPVTNIMGIAAELNDESYDPETRLMFVNSLNISAHRLDGVIADLNDVLQLKAGTSEIKETISLVKMTEAVVATLGTAVMHNDVRIETDFSAMGNVVTIKRYLHSIMYNLLSNGIKYRQQAVAPILKIKSLEVNDGYQLTFSDNGIGFEMDRKEGELFGMYKRFHSHVEGKGIGLYMVKTQVEILGGRITVNSKVGIGTTFKIFLPRVSDYAGR